jgi:hypothetical protein
MRIRLNCAWGDAPAGSEVDVIDRIANHLIARKKAVAVSTVGRILAAVLPGPAPVAAPPRKTMRIRLLVPWGNAPAGGEVNVIDRIANHLIARKKAVALAAAVTEAESTAPAPAAPAPERVAGPRKAKA